MAKKETDLKGSNLIDGGENNRTRNEQITYKPDPCVQYVNRRGIPLPGYKL